MKNSNKKMQFLKNIDEKFNDPYLNALRSMADEADSEVDDVNDNKCDGSHKEFIVKIYDINEIEEKIFTLRSELEDFRNNIRFFEGRIETTIEEIERLQAKLDCLGQ